MHRSTSSHKWIDIHAGSTHTNCRGRKWSAFSETRSGWESVLCACSCVYLIFCDLIPALPIPPASDTSTQTICDITLHSLRFYHSSVSSYRAFLVFLERVCWCYLDRIRALPLLALQSSDSRIRPTSPLSAMRSLLRRLAPACYDSLADKTVLRKDANYLLHCYYSALESNECASIWNAPNPRSLCISYLVASHSSWQSW